MSQIPEGPFAEITDQEALVDELARSAILARFEPDRNHSERPYHVGFGHAFAADQRYADPPGGGSTGRQ